MTEEQFNEAVRINNRIEQLEKVKKEISSLTNNKLSYIQKGNSIRDDWKIVGEWTMRFIADILDRHDKQIRQEIDKEIAKLKKEIEAL